MTTGSAVQGTVGGLVRGLGKAASLEATDKIIFVYGNPNGVVTANAGSQLVYDIETPDVYIADAIGGTTWNRLGSLT